MLDAFEFGEFLFLFLLLQLKELCAEHLEALLLVLKLRAFVLALHDDARRLVRHADGGRGFVDMLSARAARAVVVDAHVVHVDVDLDGVVDLGHDVARGERCVPPRLRVKRGDADETMHAFFGFQKAIGVVPLDEKARGFDARLVARLEVGGLNGKSVPLRPAPVHAQEHLRPVLRLGAARTRVEREDGVVGVVLAREEHLELECLKPLGDRVQLCADVTLHGGVVFLDAHLVEGFGVFIFGGKGFVGVDSALESREFLIDFLRRRRVVPKGRLAHFVFELGDFFLFRRDFKGNAHLIQLFAQIIECWFQIFQHVASFLK